MRLAVLSPIISTDFHWGIRNRGGPVGRDLFLGSNHKKAVFIALVNPRPEYLEKVMNKHLVDLGAPDPEQKNSPIILDIEDEREVMDTEIPEERVCYFNGEQYPHGSFIKSGTLVLECDRGAWVEAEAPDEF